MTASVVWVDSRGKYWAYRDPDSVLDWPFDWSEWLADIDDAMASVAFTAVGIEAVPIGVPANGVAAVTVTGGEVGQPASVTCRITTVGERVDDRTLNFLMVER